MRNGKSDGLLAEVGLTVCPQHLVQKKNRKGID